MGITLLCLQEVFQNLLSSAIRWCAARLQVLSFDSRNRGNLRHPEKTYTSITCSVTHLLSLDDKSCICCSENSPDITRTLPIKSQEEGRGGGGEGRGGGGERRGGGGKGRGGGEEGRGRGRGEKGKGRGGKGRGRGGKGERREWVPLQQRPTWNSDWLTHTLYGLSANLWLVVCWQLTFVGECPTMWVFLAGALPTPPPSFCSATQVNL